MTKSNRRKSRRERQKARHKQIRKDAAKDLTPDRPTDPRTKTPHPKAQPAGPQPAPSSGKHTQPTEGLDVRVATCCGIAEREEARLVRVPESGWHLFRWGQNPEVPENTVILDTWPVHACPVCGRPLDGEGLGSFLRLLDPHVDPILSVDAERLNALLAPTQPYRWGHRFINDRLKDLGYTPPAPDTPIDLRRIASTAPAAPAGVTDAT